MTSMKPPSGHVFRVERARGPVWYAKYRLPDGRQVQKKIGPAWADRGRPPAGYFTKRLAEEWLREVLDQARRGTLPGMVRTGVTFADAAEEWLRYIEQDRGRKPSTLQGYRSRCNAHLLPAFGSMAVEDDDDRGRSSSGDSRPRRVCPDCSKNKLVIQLHGILAPGQEGLRPRSERRHEVEKFPLRRTRRHRGVLARGGLGAGAGCRDPAGRRTIYLTAAFTGLRMGELLGAALARRRLHRRRRSEYERATRWVR